MDRCNFIYVRFKSLTNALASKGYNITALSPDQDVSTTNVHYIHMEKVYQTIYNPDAEKINFVEMGDQNVYDWLSEFAGFSIATCVGHVTSDGWKQLENYPNDFKVFINKDVQM